LLGLYVHIPFCRSKCAYCDFNSYAGQDHLFAPYADAVIREIEAAGEDRDHAPVGTIYLGGGTPTWLPPELLGGILAACVQSFAVLPDAEITCEANPASVDEGRFAHLRIGGVNRLSLGVQSFDDRELHLLQRSHSAEEARGAYFRARQAGFCNIGLDLIYGIPGQTGERWQATLDQALDLNPEHLSLYCLTVEQGTALARWIADGHMPPVDEDLAADLYLQACDFLASGGYEQYEISNWARETSPSDESITMAVCRHNLGTWRNEDFLGFGAGGHSSEGGRRWWNVSSPSEYIARVEAGRSPVAAAETIDKALGMAETMILGLRLTREGVSIADFEARYEQSPLDVYSDQITPLVASGLLECLPDRIRLAEWGRLLANEAFARFLPS
jgi:oxygen-independent coproporphyrinogen-3 oxidase